VRAIISPGWGGLDENIIRSAGPHVFALGNVPHDWLFQYVSAVCHHGGAGWYMRYSLTSDRLISYRNYRSGLKVRKTDNYSALLRGSGRKGKSGIP
jgi:hypothetical protein